MQSILYERHSSDVCMSRQDALDDKQISYVNAYLEGSSIQNFCPKSSSWVDGRFCACPEDMYFFYDSKKTDDSYEKCV